MRYYFRRKYWRFNSIDFLERDNKIEENERNGGEGDSPSLTTTLLPTLNNTILTLQKLITANNKITREINLLLLFLLVMLM